MMTAATDTARSTSKLSLKIPTLRKWRWPELQWYNGFSSVERIQGWQLNWLLFDLGLTARPARCSITGSSDQVGCHNENYYEPWTPYPISASAHSILHRRFRHPDSWIRLVEKHKVTGDEWFCRLSLDRVDLAAELRACHGPGIADIFARAPLPAGISIPAGQIYRGSA